MNWLKKGPELKIPRPKMPALKRPSLKRFGAKGPAVKPPAFVADLYYDLRDRRLLPLIALVLVAIAAVPILLGDSEPVEPPPAAVGPTPGPATASASLAVVEAKPGLRDYRKRLGSRTATDPFKQRYTSLPGSAKVEATQTTSSTSGGAAEETEATGETIESPPSEGGGPSGSAPSAGAPGGDGGTPPGGGEGGDSPRRFYAYRPTVRFGPAGEGELTVYEHLPLGKLLPREEPVMLFVGASEDGDRVAFNLSREVTWVRGPGRCIGGKENCSLLILRAGQAVDVMTTTPGRSFRLAVVRIEFVEVERPKPAESSVASQHGSLTGFQNFSK